MGRRKTLVEQLEKFQIDFITGKVKELGGYREVCGFYNKKDVVSAFAKELASEMYDVTGDEEPSMEYTPEPAVPAPKRERKTEKMETVKRKRRRVVINDEE